MPLALCRPSPSDLNLSYLHHCATCYKDQYTQAPVTMGFTEGRTYVEPVQHRHRHHRYHHFPARFLRGGREGPYYEYADPSMHASFKDAFRPAQVHFLASAAASVASRLAPRFKKALTPTTRLALSSL